MKTKISFIVAMALVAALGTTQAHALSLYGDSSTSVKVGSTTTVNSNTNANVNSNASSQGSTSASNGSANSQGNGTAVVDIIVNGDDARLAGNLDMSINSSAMVHSDLNLKNYAAVVAKTDSSINVITSSGNHITVTFNRPGKLFGFVPVTLHEKTNVDVDANGHAQVKVHKPWWAFLAKDDLKTDKLSAEIKSRIEADAQMMANVSANAELSAEAKARILSSIQAGAHAVYSASASGSM